MDGNAEPGFHELPAATTTLIVDGQPVVSVTYATKGGAVMQILVRSVALFLFVWIISRAIGRKELAELSSFELILLIVMGDLIQQGVTGEDRSVTGAMLAVATFALLTVGFSYAAFRSSRLERLVEGQAVVVVKDGTTPGDPRRRAIDGRRGQGSRAGPGHRRSSRRPSGDPRIGREVLLLRSDDGRSPPEQERAKEP
jgi:hypothetical protein